MPLPAQLYILQLPAQFGYRPQNTTIHLSLLEEGKPPTHCDTGGFAFLSTADAFPMVYLG
jgi:hypothetical protein